jgi:precorrin-2 dehydrogenase/sirohydrochlorin ferrochelatase
MGYLPIFIDLSERPCVVIGGGEIAERKTRSLIEAGASVVIISPAITAGLAAMSGAGTIQHLARRYRHGDLADAFLAFDATGDGATARAAAAEASARGVPINVADVPELCDFISPAVVQRGGLQIAISTGGASPALARKIREDLEGLFGPEYELIISLLERTRRWLRLQESDAGTRARLQDTLVRSELLECLKRGDFAAADSIAQRVLGASLVDIGFEPMRAVAIDDQGAGRTNESR